MANLRISFTQSSKSQVKNQLDAFLDADYNLLRHSPNKSHDIFRCEVVRGTPLIQKYIKELEVEYDIPSPLKTCKDVCSSGHSHKKLELSLRNSIQKPSLTLKDSNNRKRLSLVSTMKPRQDYLVQNNPRKLTQSRYIEASHQLNTPKFGLYETQNSHQLKIKMQGTPVQVVKDRITLIERGQSQRINDIGSKDKPIANSQFNIKGHNLENSSHKNSQLEMSDKDVVQLSISVNEKEILEKRTVKKHKREEDRLKSEESYNQENSHDTIHKNPASLKKLSRVRPEEQKNHVQDSYRYCVGCEYPILSANIKNHEITCEKFKELCVLSHKELLKRIRQKVVRLEEKIPQNNRGLNPEQVEVMRRQSDVLVSESRSRDTGSPESPRFRESYASMMKLGSKWCSALEDINKLRWFTRILFKLEQISKSSNQ